MTSRDRTDIERSARISLLVAACVMALTVALALAPPLPKPDSHHHPVRVTQTPTGVPTGGQSTPPCRHTSTGIECSVPGEGQVTYRAR
jgi:hypothetical protein